MNVFIESNPVRITIGGGGSAPEPPTPTPQKFPSPLTTQFHTIFDIALIGSVTTDFEVQEDE